VNTVKGVSGAAVKGSRGIEKTKRRQKPTWLLEEFLSHNNCFLNTTITNDREIIKKLFGKMLKIMSHQID
jgi:hypothetical protein